MFLSFAIALSVLESTSVMQEAVTRIPLSHISSNHAAVKLREAKVPGLRIMEDPSTNCILVLGDSGGAKTAVKLLAKIDRDSVTSHFPIRQVNAQNIASQLKGVPGIEKILVDAPTNTVIVVGTRGGVEAIAKKIAELDK